MLCFVCHGVVIDTRRKSLLVKDPHRLQALCWPPIASELIVFKSVSFDSSSIFKLAKLIHLHELSFRHLKNKNTITELQCGCED